MKLWRVLKGQNDFIMNILIAGPGTGKTTNIKNIVSEDGKKFLVLSFTNATVKDLQSSLAEKGVSEDNCMTLHKFAVKYNHDQSRHILLPKEVDELKKIEKGAGINFEALCDFLQCTTFDQMIERFVTFAKNNPTYLVQKLKSYESLIVDEYQDFNPLEQKLIDILIKTIKNSYILGDDDQCIYDFKEASSEKIISFYTDNNNKIISHEHKCYRCPDKVVEHATHLIQNNQNRIKKKWDKTGKAGKIEYYQMTSFDEVASDIIDKLIPIIKGDILVLSPVGFAVDPLTKQLREKDIGFTNFFNPKIPDELVTKAWEVKSIFGNYRYLNLVLLGYNKLSNRKKFYALVKKHFNNGVNFDELLKLLASKVSCGIVENRLSLDDFLSQDQYSDISILFNKSNGGSDEEKLENMFKEIEEVEEKNIKIMSIHKSKGLGADYVFMVGLNEGILPNKKKGNNSLESQRRLFFVGMTRAKKQLFLYSNIQIDGRYKNKVNQDDFKYDHKNKTWNGKSSSFISELKLDNQ